LQDFPARFIENAAWAQAARNLPDLLITSADHLAKIRTALDYTVASVVNPDLSNFGDVFLID
jgi:hypothetical protein